MARAVEFGTRHVEKGGLPFVGQLVGPDGYASEYGVNRVHETGDATAHAEIVAMRLALTERGTPDLAGTRLLATGEPCGLCYRFALDQRVEHIYVAVDAETVASWGIDYLAGYPAFGIDRARLRRDGLVRDLPVEAGDEPFQRFTQAVFPRRSCSSAPPTKGPS
ncbi:nucleoside deaminase [Amycolatopsis rhizosphaerae]|uniref:Nucleoside deaminase n=2 Tax=Amycolatopsis rhizosphaerae TaxID=2053003 RepID=A0A558CPL3_9PSEU|nr:nucleoside deaminase [Amycolatopsis rhizosphaerae]